MRRMLDALLKYPRGGCFADKETCGMLAYKLIDSAFSTMRKQKISSNM